MNRHVISVSTGRDLGSVNRLLFEPESYSLYGFGVRSKDKNDPEMVLLKRDVKAIGADAITVDSDDKVGVLNEDTRAQELVAMGKGLKGKPIVTEDGNQLGKMSTLVLNEDGGIRALHASSGILGRGAGKDISPGSVLIAGEDAIIVSSRENWQQPQQRLAA
jgi:uncharacterized protein YrrD